MGPMVAAAVRQGYHCETAMTDKRTNRQRPPCKAAALW